MKVKLIKLSGKGQIAIPKAFRDKLDSPYLEMKMENNRIILSPVPSILSLGGILNDYVKNRAENESEAWGDHVREKYSRP
ncbi:MAG: AbrB/MazE/SpoVT family DNA-binding domain-containing protein [Brevinematales bacterium]|jgi:bifunctional DNA-binding transcriptional regulator/antitoxin component of YhaV-PrlF toxin-antitoxin module